MKYFDHPASHCSFTQLLAPASLLLTAGVLLGLDLCRPSKILATVGIDPDSDGDCLVDRQERVLGTLASVTDTDHDGYTDTEELARKSSPLFWGSHPESASLSTGLTAHAERDGLHAVIAVYVPGGNIRDVDVHLGVLAGRSLRLIPQASFEARSSARFTTALDPNALIALIDFRFDRSWVNATGHLSMFATVGWRGTGMIADADVIDLFNKDGTPALAMLDPFFQPLHQLGDSEAAGPGTIYKPLTAGGGGDIPAGWTSGEICYQTSQPVGASGALVTHEIDSASCQSGWDGACPPSCSSSVGSTYTSVDPLVLIGG